MICKKKGKGRKDGWMTAMYILEHDGKKTWYIRKGKEEKQITAES